jgi:hypothetical protein
MEREIGEQRLALLLHSYACRVVRARDYRGVRSTCAAHLARELGGCLRTDAHLIVLPFVFKLLLDIKNNRLYTSTNICVCCFFHLFA